MILVVDDNPDIRDVVRLLLEVDGYQTAGAANGREAIAWLHGGETPGLILLDLTMPVMDGYQFLTIKEADPALKDIPVVVMTALPDRSRLRGFRVDECLEKPTSPLALCEAIERAASVPRS